jgi:hypothetical protein
MPVTPTIDAVLDRIRAYAVAEKLAPATLARLAGISEVATRGMHSTDWSPRMHSIRALSRLIPPDWQEGDAARATEPKEKGVGVAPRSKSGAAKGERQPRPAPGQVQGQVS